MKLTLAIGTLALIWCCGCGVSSSAPTSQPSTRPLHRGQRCSVSIEAVDGESRQKLKIHALGFPALNGWPDAWNAKIIQGQVLPYQIEFTDTADFPVEVEVTGYQGLRIMLNSASPDVLSVPLKRAPATTTGSS